MTIATDPVDRAEIDSAGGNSAALPLAQSINGWNGGDFLEHDKLNAVTRNAAQWKEWLDQTRADTAQLGFSTSFRLSTSFTYPSGGLVDREVSNDSFYVVLGRYVSLSKDRLLRYQPTIHTYTFTASMTHHFYIDAGGVIVVSIVALGTPAAPGVGFETLISVDTDATDIVSITNGDEFLTVLVRNSQALELTNILTVLAPVVIDGGNLTIDKAAAGSRQIALTVDNDTLLGWRITHNSAERLLIQELIGGVATTILDLGSSAVPVTSSRAVTVNNTVAINSSDLVQPALAVTVGALNAQGVLLTNVGGTAPMLTVTASGQSAPLVLTPVPLAPFNGSDPNGSIKIDNSAGSFFKYKDANGVTRTIWASDGGAQPDGAYTLANSNNIGVGTVIQTFNYTFVAGQRYLIKMGCRVGRFTGSTRDAQFTCTVGGVALAYSGQVILLWQGGGATELEQKFEDEVLFTAGGGGSLAVQLLVTPVNGAGSINVAARSCRVLGHFQP